MGVLWKLNFADPVLMLLMAMRAVESVVIPILISDRVAQDLGIANYTHMETTPCVIRNSTDEQLVQSAASQWAMAYWLASSLPGALTAVLIGGWSDRIGRRTPMLLALTGYAIEAMFAMATVHWNLHLAYLIAGSVIEGICGSYPTVLLAVYAHASDSSEPRKRTSRLLLLSLLEFFGVGVFNLVAGELLKYYGVFTTECTVLGGHLIGILYAGFLLADTRGKHGEDPLTEHRPSIQDSSKDSDSITTATGRDVRSYSHSVLKTFRLVLRPWPKRRQLLILLFCFELVVMNFLGISDVTVLYTEHTPLCWPSTRIGYFNAIKYGCLVIAQAIVSPLILRVQPPDRYVAQVALLAVIAYFVVCAFSHTTLQMYLGKFANETAGFFVGFHILHCLVCLRIDVQAHY